ncbi:acylphosphatase [Candidatus Parcubacteria bacterium]|nr:acylphosphatase [Candidatus Parcubacteria bacterium]
MQKLVKIKVFGQVQGVCFRENTKRKAEELGLVGWVQNVSDGSVYAEAEGEEVDLEKLTEWCHQGPKFAQVERVEEEYSEKLLNYKDFCIKF